MHGGVRVPTPLVTRSTLCMRCQVWLLKTCEAGNAAADSCLLKILKTTAITEQSQSNQRAIRAIRDRWTRPLRQD